MSIHGSLAGVQYIKLGQYYFPAILLHLSISTYKILKESNKDVSSYNDKMSADEADTDMGTGRNDE